MAVTYTGTGNKPVPHAQPATNKNIEDIYELSDAQADVLRQYIRNPGQGMFHENLVFHFEGTVDVERFAKCWDTIVERHSILRTAFFHENLSKPLQVVLRKAKLPMEHLDWRNWSELQQEQQLDSLIEQDHITPYVLETAPLMRLSFIQRSDSQFSLWWRFHHLLMDGWAFAVVMFDLLGLYREGIGNVNRIPLAEGYPYKSYVQYRKHRCTKEEQAFWSDYLQGVQSQSPLSGVKSASVANKALKVRQGRRDLSASELFPRLQQMVKANGLTLNGVFQGIFSLLMSHYSNGGTDIVTGQTVADRPLHLPNAHSRVGLFINTLPIRCKVKKEERFVDWAREIQTQMMKAFTFAASSETEVKRWCGLEEHSELFQGVLFFENIPLNDDPFYELPFKLESTNLESRPRFPISFFVWPDETLKMKIIFDQWEFEGEAINRMLEQVKSALAMLIANPSLSVQSFLEGWREMK